MNDNKSPFQLILFAVLGVLIVVAMILFATKKASNNQGKLNIDIWGVFPKEFMLNLSSNPDFRGQLSFTYVEIDKNLFKDKLIDSIAEGVSPDFILVPISWLQELEPKLQKIPYTYYSISDYKKNFIEASETALRKDGILAFPFLADPLIMYWNRDSFTNATIPRAPQTWADILSISPSLTKKDANFNVSKSAVALGSFSNIQYAKDIFITLLLQAGNPVIQRKEISDVETFSSVLPDNLGYTVNPAQAVLLFFSQFADPSKNVYTWNSSLPNSLDMFTKGDLAIYFGLSSDYEKIRRKNPNLNFGVDVVPQSNIDDTKSTYGDVYVIAAPRTSTKIGNINQVVDFFLGDGVQKYMYDLTGLAPVSRNSLFIKNTDDLSATLITSALIQKSIYEPSITELETIFGDMVKLYLSGLNDSLDSINQANQKINKLLLNNSRDAVK